MRRGPHPKRSEDHQRPGARRQRWPHARGGRVPIGWVGALGERARPATETGGRCHRGRL